jgi:hypothetical protein
MEFPQSLNRRSFLRQSAQAAVAMSALGSAAQLRGDASSLKAPLLGKAEHCVLLWLGGGMAQIDTFDPKPQRGVPAEKKPGSYYASIDTAIPGTQVCEHLPQVAGLMDRFTLLRTVNHNVIDEHAAATNRMHTGRPVSGSVVYPSLGSIIAHERPSEVKGVPPYVVIGYPSATRGPGFLGPKAGYVYLTDTATGPTGLTRPPEITIERQARREALLGKLRGRYIDTVAGDRAVVDYDAAVEQGFRLAGSDFMKSFDLSAESSTLRQSYGDEFGQRCLLTRRLLQRGVRFVEVSFNLNFINGAGWDTHNQAQLNQHVLIQQLDAAVATLVRDLEANRMLEKTLIVIASEFGRPAGFDGGGGRGHHGKCFSVILAGGGLRNGQVIGQTDDLAMSIVSEPLSVPDLFATIVATMGIDPARNLMDGERPVPITDGGKAVGRLFA